MKLEELKELERIEREAENARDKTHRERGDFVRERRQAAHDAIEKEADEKFKATIEAQHQVYVAARIAADEARIEVAESFENAPYPKGTKFFVWEMPRYSIRSQRILNKDKAGVIEVVTRDTVHPDNKAAYRCARVGDYIIRELKKDGTPSKKYERINLGHDGKWHLPWDWYPEGVNPNAEDKS